MKFFILLLAIVALAHAEFSKEEEERWQAFKLEHGKLFLSPGKEKTRKETFLKNVEEIEAHNEAFLNGETTYVKAVHKHSDLSDEAFLERFGGVNMPAEARTYDPSKVVTLRGTPPASLDLRQRGGIDKIRDQGQCGSCWTFSTASAVEYAYWKRTGYLGDLSEQNLVDCVYGTAGGCQGGWMPTAMDWIAKNGGIAWENQYPYTAVNGNCKASSIASKSVWLKSDKPSVQVASDDVSIKTALNDYGVLSVCVDAGGWGSYSSGVYFASNYASPSCSHAVSLIGYGTDTNGIPYWIIRNSWNTWWGEQGYMRLDARRDSSGHTYGGIMLNYAYYPQIY